MFELSLITISFIVGLATVPALGWLWVYRHLDHRDPEPIKALLTAVLFGIFSTLPVFALQAIFTEFPNFNLVSLLNQTFSNTLVFSLFFLLFVAFVEELVKSVAFLSISQRFEKVFNQIVDGIMYAAAVGLGFAIAENVYYFIRAFNEFGYSVDFFSIFTIRSLGTMLAHTLFAGVFGFYFARAYFSPFVSEESKTEKIWHNIRANLRSAVKLHTTFFCLMPSTKRETIMQSMTRNAMIFEGFIMAIGLHLLYNFLIKVEVFGQHWTFLIVPTLFLMAWYVWSRFFVRAYTRIIDFVRVRRESYRVRVR